MYRCAWFLIYRSISFERLRLRLALSLCFFLSLDSRKNGHQAKKHIQYTSRDNTKVISIMLASVCECVCVLGKE